MTGCELKFAGSNSRLKGAGYTLDEEEKIYDRLLQDVYDNPRWYLDNLQFLREFRLRWVDYRTKTPVLPYKFVRK